KSSKIRPTTPKVERSDIPSTLSGPVGRIARLVAAVTCMAVAVAFAADTPLAARIQAVQQHQAMVARAQLRIPAKANAVPKGSRTVFRAEAEHDRSVATLAF